MVSRPLVVKSMVKGDQSLSAISPGPWTSAGRLGAVTGLGRTARTCFFTAV